MKLDIERIRRAFPARQIEYYASIDSTMTAAAGCDLGAVVLADEQTAGIGRHGHAWHSEPGSGIYCSIVLRPAPLLTLALGLATAEAIARATGVACDIRWPNDLMAEGKKAAGILVQLVEGKAIAGIGINVNHGSFPPELAIEAVSLSQVGGAACSREEIIEALLPAIDAAAQLRDEEVLRLFTQASSYAAGRRVTVQQPDGVIEGVTAGLDRAGYLIVRREDGTDTLVIAGGVRAAGT